MMIAQFDPLDKVGFSAFREIPSELFGKMFDSAPDLVGRITLAVAMQLEGYKCDWRAGKDAEIEELMMAAMVGENRCPGTQVLIQLYRNSVMHGMYADPDDFTQTYEALIPKKRSGPFYKVRESVLVARGVVRRMLELYGESRPQVIAGEGLHDPHKTLEEVKNYLPSMNVYQRNAELVAVIQSNHLKSRDGGLAKEMRESNRPVIRVHDTASLTPVLTKSIDFRAWKLRREKGQTLREVVRWSPAEPFVKMLLKDGHYPDVPVINGIADGPYIRRDGSICNEAGYDIQTGWFLGQGVDGIDVPEQPLECEAVAGLERLEWLVQDVPFKSRRDRVTWIAGLLTLLARPAIEGPTPGFMITSNNIGTGKNLLINLMHTIAYGKVAPCNVPPQGMDNAREWAQTMFSFARAGTPFVWFDELAMGSNVGNPVVNKYLTSHNAVERLFHKQDPGEAAWNATVFFTGNSLGIASDCARRILPVVLQYMKAGEPHLRPAEAFAIPDIMAYTKETRPELLSAAFTMLRWHIRTGMTKMPDARGFASFEAWASMVRDCIARLTNDPITGSESVDITTGDASVVSHDAGELGLLLSGLRKYQAVKGDKPWTVSELYGDMGRFENQSTEWFSVLGERFDPNAKQHAFTVSVGAALNKYKSRPLDGHYIERLTLPDKRTAYQVKEVC